MNTSCDCCDKPGGVHATVKTLDGQFIARGILFLKQAQTRGHFWPILRDGETLNVQDYNEVIAEVGNHTHKLHNWWLQTGLVKSGGRPADPDHFNFEADSQ